MTRKQSYKFDGDWEFELEFPILSKINSEEWYSDDIDQILREGYVPILILDEKTLDPEPTNNQSNAIEYLLQNEEDLVNTIRDLFIHQINQKFVEWNGGDYWIPEMNSILDLGNLLRINKIQILVPHKKDISYKRIDFEYKGDVEHGISIILHKNRLVGFFDNDDMDYSCIIKDLNTGIDAFEAQYKIQETPPFQIHQPLEKYKKLKPWQVDSTYQYFQNLFEESLNKEIIEEIESNKWDINHRFADENKNLPDIAAYYNNVEILRYLVDNKGDFTKSILQCYDWNGRLNKESLIYLIDRGANINMLLNNEKTILCYWLESFIRDLVQKEKFKEENSERYKHYVRNYNIAKYNIQFFLELGANPNILDNENRNYKDIINMTFADYINKENEVLEQVEALILPKTK